MGQVTYKVEGGIAILSIDRPEALNALSRTIVDEMDAIVEQLKDDKDVRVLIIHSEKNFAAGADIKGMAECTPEEAKQFGFTPTYNKFEALEIPVIAAIEGYALGGGMELALTADIRIAGASAKMGFPEVSLGIFPGAGGCIRGPRICGEAFAKELIFTGDSISAQRALLMGLINDVVEDGTTLDAALKMAGRIMKRGPVAVRAAKAVINAGLGEPDMKRSIEIEWEAWPKLFTTYDQKEGMKAFIEKRKPNFENR